MRSLIIYFTFLTFFLATGVTLAIDKKTDSPPLKSVTEPNSTIQFHTNLDFLRKRVEQLEKKIKELEQKQKPRLIPLSSSHT